LRAENFELAMAYLATGNTNGCDNHELFLRRAQTELEQFQTFVNPFLCALQYTGTTTTATTTRLSNVFVAAMNNQYHDLKSLIADYVGVPRGKLLRHIRAALRHNRAEPSNSGNS
jgi:hypothetical protein